MRNAGLSRKADRMRFGAWGFCPMLGRSTRWLAGLLLLATAAWAAYTEPRLALLRASALHAASGRITLRIEGSFSFADAVQLALPLTVTVTQDALSARFDLAGNAFLSSGGPEQRVDGPGVVRVARRELWIVLPPQFGAGSASVQITAAYGDKPIASNRLQVTL